MDKHLILIKNKVCSLKMKTSYIEMITFKISIYQGFFPFYFYYHESVIICV